MQGFSNIFRFGVALIVTLFFAFSGLKSTAQDGILDVHGTVKNDETRKNMDAVRVSVTQNGKEYDAYNTAGNGKYGFNLPLGHLYVLTFSTEGFVYKKIEINTKGIPPEDMAGGFKLNMDMTLFENIEGFDLKIMDKPLGKASFDPIRNSVEFDYDYTARMQKEIADELKRLKNMEKEMEKLLKEFNDLIAKGDKAMTAKNYADAVNNFEAATKVIPNREPAPAKLAEAQAALDAENAAKELEKRYNDLIVQAKKDIGKKKFAEAQTGLQEAMKLKPDEREPKDLLNSIDKELQEIEKRAQYDGMIVAADKEFNSKNYAVSIKKYEEALELYPAETYPRDQIKAARKVLDDQLAAAAAEEERNRKYNDALAAGDRNMENAQFEAAINQYRAALDIKPDEKYPKDKIKEAEDAIANATKAERDALASAERSEIEKLEKEYRDMVKMADDKFKAKNLQDARSDYEAALAMKPNENYPKTRIDRIDELLAEADEKAARDRQATDAAAVAEAEYQSLIQAADKKFDDGDLEGAKLAYEGALLVKPNDKYPNTRISRINEMLSKQASAEEDMLAEEARKREEERLAQEEADRLAREARMNELDDERLRRQQEEEAERARLAEERQRKAEEERRRLSDFANNADRTTEDDAERYYREARLRDEMARKERIEEKKEQQSILVDNSATDARLRMQERQEEMAVVDDAMTKIYRDGEMRREFKVGEKEKDKERYSSDLVDWETNAERKMQQSADNAEQKKEQLSSLVEQDRFRIANIEKEQMKREDYAELEAAYISKGNSKRVDNEFDIERHKEKLTDIAGEGENMRLDNVEKSEESKIQHASYSEDLRRAADERRSFGEGNVDSKKEQFRDVGKGKEEMPLDNALAIKRTKELNSDQQLVKAEEARSRAYNKRRELFSKDAGSEKSYDDYRLPPGAENLEEGVQEKSYEEGNKMIIERTVRRGNKVDTYRKVISKAGIYYFKNGKSITEGLWKRDTLDATN